MFYLLGGFMLGFALILLVLVKWDEKRQKHKKDLLSFYRR